MRSLVVPVIGVLLSASLVFAENLRQEVETRYGEKMIQDFERMQSGVRAPRIQSIPESSEPEALLLRREIVRPLRDPGHLRTGMDAVEEGLREWASGPGGQETKDKLPFKFRRE